MGRNPGPVSIVVDNGPAAFGFLVVGFGFKGPTLLRFPTVEPSAQLGYERGALGVQVSVHEGREPGVETELTWSHGEPHPWRAGLGILLVASGLGTRQDVPDSARSGRLALQRLDAQSRGLRTLLSNTTEADLQALIRSNRGRS